MATILEEKKSTYGNPYAYYKVETTNISNRTLDEVDITVKITSRLSSNNASLGTGYTLKGNLYLNGSWSNDINIKTSSDIWNGTTSHTITQTLTVTGLSGNQTSLTNVKFRVISNASDSAAQLNATACKNITIPISHNSPVINRWSIVETNPALLNIGIPSNTYVKIISSVKVEITDATYYDDADFQKMTLYQELEDDEYQKLIDLPTNPAYFIPSQANLDYYVNLRLYDNKNGASEISDEAFRFKTIDYSLLTLSANAKRVGQTSGQVSINCTGNYFNGEIGNINQKQSNNYVPTIKYKYWKYGDSEPASYDNTVLSGITVNNGAYTLANLNIGSTTEGDINYFDPKYSYRIKIQVNDNFTSIESSEISISTGEYVWAEFDDEVDFKKLTIQKEPIITIKSYENYTGSIVADANDTITYNIAKTGYTPIGIISMNCDGSRASSIRLFRWYIDGTNAKVSYKNAGTNSLIANDTSIKIWVAYIRG